MSNLPRDVWTPWTLRWGLLLWAWLAATAGVSAQPTARLIVDQWRVEDGLPQNTVTSIGQDGRGYLWVATRKGLARFDGAQFDAVTRVSGLDIGNMRLTAVLPDPDGGLWVGTYGHGVLHIANGAAVRYGEAEGTPHDVVWGLARDGGGRVWLGSSRGARYFEEGRWHTPSLPPELARVPVNVVHPGRDGRIWLGTTGHGLISLQGGVVRRYSVRDGLPADTANSVAEAPDGTIWVGTPRGLGRIQGERVTAPDAASGASRGRVRQVLVDRRGVLWAATHGGGLVRHDGGVWRAFGRQDGLSSEYLVSLHEDRDGALWVGTLSGGLNRLAPAARELLDARSGLPPHPITTIYQHARTRTFWVGTYGGGLAHISDGAIRVYTTTDGLPADTITSVAGGPGDSVWVATHSAGAFRFGDGKVLERVGPEIVGTPLRTIEVDHAAGGAVWFGGDGLIRYQGGSWRRIGEAEGLRSTEVRVIAAQKERVWVGTYGGGLQSIERDGRIVSWGPQQGLTNAFVTSLHHDSAGSLWIGTYGGGLFRLRDGRVAGVTTRDGLPDDVVFDVMEDNVGRLWLTGTEGLAAVRMADVHARIDGRPSLLSMSLYGRTEGVPGTDGTDGNQPLGWLAFDGRLWFATVDGVVIFDPTEVADEPAAPVVWIDSISVGDREVASGALDEPLASRNLAIDFSAPLLRGGAAVRYEYRLVGLDDRWVEAAGRTASFTNLSPGPYRFEVRARARRGAEPGAVRSLDFAVSARFYETSWFIAAAAALLGASAVGLVRMRVRRLHERQQQLEGIVADRTAALRHEMQERERSVRDRRVLDERIQQAQRLESLAVLAGGVAHDFNNLLVGVLGEVSLALGELPKGAPARQHLERIERAAERASELTAQMLAYSGRSRFIVQPVAAEDVVREAQELLGSLIPPAITVVLDFPRGLPPVAGDPAQLRQVMMNLLTNAADAIGERPGRITVSAGTRLVRPDDSVAALRPDQLPLSSGTHVWVSVHDDGTGMDAAMQARIFDPFFTTKPAGRGLGLAAVQGIVRSHGGRILVASEPSVGSTFTVLLPAMRDAEVPRAVTQGRTAALEAGGAMATAAAPTPPPHAAGARPAAAPHGAPQVLLVDDERLVRDVARVALTRAGHTVTEVSTGEDAVAVFEEHPDDFAVVVLDLTLPGMQGRAVMKAVRALRSDVPIVLTSGYTAEEAADLTTAPRTTFLAKPWRPDQLVRSVRDLTDASATGAGNLH